MQVILLQIVCIINSLLAGFVMTHLWTGHICMWPIVFVLGLLIVISKNSQPLYYFKQKMTLNSIMSFWCQDIVLYNNKIVIKQIDLCCRVVFGTFIEWVMCVMSLISTCRWLLLNSFSFKIIVHSFEALYVSLKKLGSTQVC